MRNTPRSVGRMFWIFRLCLALLPFCTNAGEIRSLLRYAVILAHRSNSERSDRSAARRYRTAMSAQDGIGCPNMVGENVVLSLPASSERLDDLTETSDHNDLGSGSLPKPTPPNATVIPPPTNPSTRSYM